MTYFLSVYVYRTDWLYRWTSKRIKKDRVNIADPEHYQNSNNLILIKIIGVSFAEPDPYQYNLSRIQIRYRVPLYILSRIKICDFLLYLWTSRRKKKVRVNVADREHYIIFLPDQDMWFLLYLWSNRRTKKSLLRIRNLVNILSRIQICTEWSYRQTSRIMKKIRVNVADPDKIPEKDPHHNTK